MWPVWHRGVTPEKIKNYNSDKSSLTRTPEVTSNLGNTLSNLPVGRKVDFLNLSISHCDILLRQVLEL